MHHLIPLLAKARPTRRHASGSAILLAAIRTRNGNLNGEGTDDEEDTNPLIDLNLPICPKSLEGYRFISVELASLVAGTANRGDFEKRVQNLIREAGNSKTILFIDEIHTLLGTGGGDGGLNAANLLKPALARGELQVIGATTTPEYRTYIERDGALERRFQPLNVKEPTVDETLDILEAVRPRYEEYHGVEYTPKAMEAAAKLSDRYLNDRFLPDKAIDLLDEAGSMVKMDIFDEEEDDIIVTEDTVAEVISEISGIPIGRLDTGEKERLRNLEEDMGRRIKGQERAVRAVAKSIRRARSGLRDGRRPIASFMFCGPTVSCHLFSSDENWIRMNFFSLTHLSLFSSLVPYIRASAKLNCASLLLKRTMVGRR